MTCGSTAGYLTPLLRSESQSDHHSTDTPVCIVHRTAAWTDRGTQLTMPGIDEMIYPPSRIVESS
jgi:hypothetical protein